MDTILTAVDDMLNLQMKATIKDHIMSSDCFNIEYAMPLFDHLPDDRQYDYDNVNDAEDLINRFVFKDTRKHKSIGFIYIIEYDDGCFKIGKTQHPKTRLTNLQNHGRTIVNVKLYYRYNYSKIEKYLHKLNNEFKIKGEYFSVIGDIVYSTLANHIDDDISDKISDCESQSWITHMDRKYTHVILPELFGVPVSCNSTEYVNNLNTQIESLDDRCVTHVNSPDVLDVLYGIFSILTDVKNTIDIQNSHSMILTKLLKVLNYWKC